MGAGKTAVGKVLSKKIKLPLVEMDKIILKESRRQTIKEIFEKDGEKHFRSLETKICQSLKSQDNLIISTGGGVISNSANIKNLKKYGQTFYLKTSFSTIDKRLKNDMTRPLFKDKKAVKKLFNMRRKLYEEYADKVIITDNKTVNKVANFLIKSL